MKKPSDIQVPTDLWKEKSPVWNKTPSLKFSTSVDKKYGFMWVLSLNNALKNGLIAADILEGKLSAQNYKNIKYGYFTNDWFYEDNLPEFYKKYGKLLELKEKKQAIEDSILSFGLPKSDKPVSIGDVFFYDKNTDSLKTKAGEFYTSLSTASLDQPERVGYGTVRVPFSLKNESEIKSDTPITATSKSGTGKTYYFTAPVKSNEQKQKIQSLQKEIDEISYYLQNLSDEEVNKQQTEFIHQYVEPAIPYLQKKIREETRREEAGLSVDDVKQIQKEKAEARQEKKSEDLEYAREENITQNNIPRTIEEFEKRSNAIRCSDAVVGDVVLFSEAVFSGSYKTAKFEGNRRILGLIEKDSYGRNKGQHSFTIYVLDSDGQDAFGAGESIRRMGRNMYKTCSSIQYAAQEVRDEKHKRGEQAKEAKYWNWLSEAENEGQMFKLDKIPSSFIKKHLEHIKEAYPRIGAMQEVEKYALGGITPSADSTKIKHDSLGSSKELGLTANISGHDMIAKCGGCSSKFTYANNRRLIDWECPNCKLVAPLN